MSEHRNTVWDWLRFLGAFIAHPIRTLRSFREDA